MATVTDTINNTREATITLHYSASLAELTEKAKNEPLRTNFHIRAGCVSDDISNEITRRLVANGVKAEYVPKGFFSTRYIDVTISLPASLVREEVKSEQKKEEVKTEEVKKEEVKAEQVKTEEVTSSQ